jgi:hypothetical protein
VNVHNSADASDDENVKLYLEQFGCLNKTANNTLISASDAIAEGVKKFHEFYTQSLVRCRCAWTYKVSSTRTSFPKRCPSLWMA